MRGGRDLDKVAPCARFSAGETGTGPAKATASPKTRAQVWLSSSRAFRASSATDWSNMDSHVATMRQFGEQSNRTREHRLRNPFVGRGACNGLISVRL